MFLSATDLKDGVPMLMQIGGERFAVMSDARYNELFMAEMERDALKAAFEKIAPLSPSALG